MEEEINGLRELKRIKEEMEILKVEKDGLTLTPPSLITGRTPERARRRIHELEERIDELEDNENELASEIASRMLEKYRKADGKLKREIARKLACIFEIYSPTTEDRIDRKTRDEIMKEAEEADKEEILSVLKKYGVEEVSTNGYWYKFEWDGRYVNLVNQFYRLLVESYKKEGLIPFDTSSLSSKILNAQEIKNFIHERAMEGAPIRYLMEEPLLNLIKLFFFPRKRAQRIRDYYYKKEYSEVEEMVKRDVNESLKKLSEKFQEVQEKYKKYKKEAFLHELHELEFFLNHGSWIEKKRIFGETVDYSLARIILDLFLKEIDYRSFIVNRKDHHVPIEEALYLLKEDFRVKVLYFSKDRNYRRF